MAQTATVSAGEDQDAIGDTVALAHAAAGGEYAGVSADLAVTVTDDETAGVSVEPTSMTVLAGRDNSYSVVLDSQPAGDVTVTVSGHDGSGLTLGGLSQTNTLTFTVDNWGTAQTVAVAAAEDASAASVMLAHAVSSSDDTDYDGAAADGVG